MTTLTVLTKRTGPIRGRHPWVFSGALKSIPDGIPSGELVKLIDQRSSWYGGYSLFIPQESCSQRSGF
jgi:hypothetical protein